MFAIENYDTLTRIVINCLMAGSSFVFFFVFFIVNFVAPNKYDSMKMRLLKIGFNAAGMFISLIFLVLLLVFYL